MQDLKVALLQTDVVWQDAEQNRINFSSKIYELNEKVDLIVLPEMFSTGFSMKPHSVAESIHGETVRWMLKLASEKNAAICGSVIISEATNFYNRFVFVYPSGEINFYNKRHLFSLAGEDEVYTKGEEKVVIEYKGWKICPQVCYDLRFPVFARNVENYDVLIYVANWPKLRINAWDALLKARSIENMCYTIGVNRIGEDGNSLEYNGHSAVYDCLGEKQSTKTEEVAFIEVVELQKKHISVTRNKLNFLTDKDVFDIN